MTRRPAQRLPHRSLIYRLACPPQSSPRPIRRQRLPVTTNHVTVPAAHKTSGRGAAGVSQPPPALRTFSRELPFEIGEGLQMSRDIAQNVALANDPSALHIHYRYDVKKELLDNPEIRLTPYGCFYLPSGTLGKVYTSRPMARNFPTLSPTRGARLCPHLQASSAG